MVSFVIQGLIRDEAKGQMSGQIKHVNSDAEGLFKV